MGRKKKNGTLGDLEMLLHLLQREWKCSKEAVWRMELPKSIIKICNKELERESRYLQHLSDSDKGWNPCEEEGEELPLLRMVYATKNAYVLMRVAKKLVTALTEMPDRSKLVVMLDEDEYRLVVTRFLEYL